MPTSSRIRSERGSEQDWREPGVHRVAPDVRRIPLPLPGDGLRAVNVYVLTDDDGAVMIDGGWAVDGAMEVLESGLAGIGLGLGDIREVLVTHAHRDHYTLAVALRERTGAMVRLPEGEGGTLQRIVDPETTQLQAQMAQLREHGAAGLAELLLGAGAAGRPVDTRHWAGPDGWIRADEILAAGPHRLRALTTPGHTKGHMVFHDEERALLFAGDHVLPRITPAIGFEPAPSAAALVEYLGSLRMILALPDCLLLPAHGAPGPSAHARALELIDHHEERLAQCLALLDATPKDAFAVASGLTWTGRSLALDELEPYHRMIAVVEIAAHLVALHHRRLAVADVRDGVRRFRSA